MGLWYLAGPFFNPEQTQAAETIRDLVKASGREYYAPVEHMFQGGIHDSDKAQEVFNSNIENLKVASVILCHIDWLLPINRELRVVERLESAEAPAWMPARSGPICLPDSGTVWEMGYAYALHHNSPFMEQIVAYSLRPTGKLNLMLARCCDGYLSGWDEVKEFVKTSELNLLQRNYSGKEV